MSPPTTTKTPTSRGALLGRMLWAVALVFVVMGSLSAYERLMLLHRWPQVEATVLSSQLDRRASDSKNRDMCAAMIGIRYTVDGKVYQARVPFTEGSQRTARAREYAARFPVGATRMVRHAPGDPQQVRLDADYSFLFFARALAWFGAALITGMIGSSLKRVDFRPR